MTSPWIFICPSSRGIGHALTRRLLLGTTLPVLATARGNTSDVKASLLDSLGVKASQVDDVAPRLSVVTCDVTDESSVASAAAHAAELFPRETHHLRLACAIPGMLHAEKNPSQIDAKLALDTFRVNTIGPMLLLKHFGEFLPRRATAELEAIEKPADATGGDGVRVPPWATWMSMAARVGSTGDNKAGGWYSYRASKAGVISMSKSFDNFLQARSGDQAMSVAYHPGTVKTGLSEGFWESVEKDKLFTPEYAADRMVEVLSGLKLDQRGRCWDWKNTEVPP